MTIGYPCCGSLQTGVHLPGCPRPAAIAGGVVPQKVAPVPDPVSRGQAAAGSSAAAANARAEAKRGAMQAFMADRRRAIEPGGGFVAQQRLTYMADARGWVMARVPGCTPFVIAEAEWAALPRWSPAGPPKEPTP